MQLLLQLLIQGVLTLVLALLFGWIYWNLRARAQKLPEHMRLALEQFAVLAVCKVEQVASSLSPEAKKALAVAAISQLCKDFGLPLFSAEAMDIAIEAAIQLLPKPVIVKSDNPPKFEPPKQPKGQ